MLTSDVILLSLDDLCNAIAILAASTICGRHNLKIMGGIRSSVLLDMFFA